MNICQLPTCNNPINPNRKPEQKYCCNAHKQKAYRQRNKPAEQRNAPPVTLSTYSAIAQAVDTLPIDQLYTLQQRVDSLIVNSNTAGAGKRNKKTLRQKQKPAEPMTLKQAIQLLKLEGHRVRKVGKNHPAHADGRHFLDGGIVGADELIKQAEYKRAFNDKTKG